MSKKLFYLFILLSFQSLSSTLFIGNGGELFEIDSKLVLRDFAEYNLFNQPHFECNDKSFPSVNKIDLIFFSKLRISKELLSQKLCDIQLISPKLELVIAGLINHHSWVLVDQELGLLPDDSPLFELKSRKRLQLANRTLSTIRINKDLWFQLDESQKIGLIIHEMIYSLLKPFCIDQECNYKKQPARIARQITAMLFNKYTYSQLTEKENVKRSITQYLEIDDIANFTSEYNFKITTSLIDQKGQAIYQLSTSEISELNEHINHVCNLITTKESEEKKLKVHVSLYSKVFSISSFSYQSNYGTEYGAKPIISNNIHAFVYQNIGNINVCESILLKKISEKLF